VPFTLVHAGKRRQIKNTDNTETNTTTKKQTTQNTAKQNYPGLVASYNTRPGSQMGLFYSAPEPRQGWTQWHEAKSGSLYL